MADLFSIKSLTVRDEFKKTQVFPPMLQVNLGTFVIFLLVNAAGGWNLHLPVLLGHLDSPQSLLQRRQLEGVAKYRDSRDSWRQLVPSSSGILIQSPADHDHR